MLSNGLLRTVARSVTRGMWPDFNTGVVAILWVWFAAVLVLNLPGHLTTDSLVQIAEGRSRLVQSWNPPFSSWLFGTLVTWGGGTELIVVLQGLLLVLSIPALLQGATTPSRWAWLPLGFLLCTPLFLVYPGIVWKDVWFAHCALLAFGMAALRATGRGVWTEGVALFLLTSAMLSRQTGILVCVAAVCAMAAAAHARHGVRRWLLGAGIRLLVLLVAASLSSTAVKSRMSVQGDAVGTGFRLVAIFDIAGLLQRVPGSTLGVLDRSGFETQAWAQGARDTFSAERIDTLVQPPLQGPRSLDTPLLLQQWADLVTHHPGAYLAHRWETFAWFSGLREQTRCLPIHVGIEPAALTSAAGVRNQPSAWGPWLYHYSRWFVGTPYFAPMAWSLLSLVLLIAWCWRRQWAEPGLWLQVGALTYTASFAMAGLSCDVRYSYFSIVAAGLGAIRWMAHGASLSRSQHT